MVSAQYCYHAAEHQIDASFGVHYRYWTQRVRYIVLSSKETIPLIYALHLGTGSTLDFLLYAILVTDHFSFSFLTCFFNRVIYTFDLA
jgi:hypothetical protein